LRVDPVIGTHVQGAVQQPAATTQQQVQKSAVASVRLLLYKPSAGDYACRSAVLNAITH
jgi:hypothetical protein